MPISTAFESQPPAALLTEARSPRACCDLKYYNAYQRAYIYDIRCHKAFHYNPLLKAGWLAGCLRLRPATADNPQHFLL